MKRYLLSTICALSLSCTSVALAQDDGDKKTEDATATATVIVSDVEVVNEEADSDKGESKLSGKVTIEINGKKHEFEFGDERRKVVTEIRKVIKDGDHEASIRAGFFGHGMIIGPDGETKEFKLGDLGGSKEALEKLPEEVRKRLEKAMKDSSKGAIFEHGIMIGPDGVKKAFKLGEDKHLGEALKHLPEEARKKVEQAMKGAGDISIQSIGSRGRAIVIGPDGVKKEFKFGDGNEEIDFDIIEHLPKTLQYKIQRSKKTRSESNDSDPLVEKLDLILKRLDKIEKEMRSLKKAQ